MKPHKCVPSVENTGEFVKHDQFLDLFTGFHDSFDETGGEEINCEEKGSNGENAECHNEIDVLFHFGMNVLDVEGHAYAPPDVTDFIALF